MLRAACACCQNIPTYIPSLSLVQYLQLQPASLALCSGTATTLLHRLLARSSLLYSPARVEARHLSALFRSRITANSRAECRLLCTCYSRDNERTDSTRSQPFHQPQSSAIKNCANVTWAIRTRLSWLPPLVTRSHLRLLPPFANPDQQIQYQQPPTEVHTPIAPLTSCGNSRVVLCRRLHCYALCWRSPDQLNRRRQSQSRHATETFADFLSAHPKEASTSPTTRVRHCFDSFL